MLNPTDLFKARFDALSYYELNNNFKLWDNCFFVSVITHYFPETSDPENVCSHSIYSTEGLPGGVLVPLFPSNIALCSHVPTPK